MSVYRGRGWIWPDCRATRTIRGFWNWRMCCVWVRRKVLHLHANRPKPRGIPLLSCPCGNAKMHPSGGLLLPSIFLSSRILHVRRNFRVPIRIGLLPKRHLRCGYPSWSRSGCWIVYPSLWSKDSFDNLARSWNQRVLLCGGGWMCCRSLNRHRPCGSTRYYYVDAICFWTGLLLPG